MTEPIRLVDAVRHDCILVIDQVPFADIREAKKPAWPRIQETPLPSALVVELQYLGPRNEEHQPTKPKLVDDAFTRLAEQFCQEYLGHGSDIVLLHGGGYGIVNTALTRVASTRAPDQPIYSGSWQGIWWKDTSYEGYTIHSSSRTGLKGMGSIAIPKCPAFVSRKNQTWFYHLEPWFSRAEWDAACEVRDAYCYLHRRAQAAAA